MKNNAKLTKDRIEDAGMKIGGAKKDIYGKSQRDSFSDMSFVEVENLAKKSKIWRDNNKEIFNGKKFEDFDFFWLLMQKELKRSLVNEPHILNPFYTKNLTLREALKDSEAKYRKQANQLYIYFVEQLRDLTSMADLFQNSSQIIQNIMDFYNQEDNAFYKENSEDVGHFALRALHHMTPLFFTHLDSDTKLNKAFKDEMMANYQAFYPLLGSKVTLGKNAIEYLLDNRNLALNVLIAMQNHLRKNVHWDKEYCLKHDVYNYDLFCDEVAKKINEIKKKDKGWVFNEDFDNFIKHLNQNKKFQNTAFLMINNRLNVLDLIRIRDFEKDTGYITLNLNEIEQHEENKLQSLKKELNNLENTNQEQSQNLAKEDNSHLLDENTSTIFEDDKTKLMNDMKNEGFSIEDFEKRKNKFNKNITDTIPHLSHLKRIGPDWRKGRDVNSEDFIQEFGFRGVEYGESLPQKERQVIINFAYDSFCDLAYVLNTHRKYLSLNLGIEKLDLNNLEDLNKIQPEKSLALAFGARGKGKALAHFETKRNVINLTRLRGAGALVHEYGHALEFMKNGQIDVITRGDEFFAQNTMNALLSHLKQIENPELKTKEKLIESYQNTARKKYDEIVAVSFSYLNQSIYDTLKEFKIFQQEIYSIIHPIIDKALEKNKENQNLNIEFFTSGLRYSSLTKMDKYVKNDSRWQIVGNYEKSDVFKQCIEKIDSFAKYKNLTSSNQRNFISNMEILIGKVFEIEFLEKAKQESSINFGDLIYNNTKPKTKFYEDALNLDNKKEGAYWSSYTELGARAFEDYIFTKMKEKEIENNFLLNHERKKQEIFELDYYTQEIKTKETVYYPSQKEGEMFYPYFEKYVKSFFKYNPSMERDEVLKNHPIIETNLNLSLTKEKNLIKSDEEVEIVKQKQEHNTQKIDNNQTLSINDISNVSNNNISSSLEDKIDNEVKRKRGRPKKEQTSQLGFGF